MGQSTNAVLAYGYDLGGDESEWKIEEAGEYGAWEPDWHHDEETDLISAAEQRLLESVGFAETYEDGADGYFRREREAQERLGVKFESYCSGDYPMWVLAAHKITVYRGDSEVIDPAELAALPERNGWDAKLQAAVKTLGITPKQAKPAWLLVSYWG